MRLLILYGTTEGQTAKIAAFLAARAEAAGHEVRLHDVASCDPAPAPAAFTAVILAASLHMGQYQTGVLAYARAHATALNAMRSAFLPVSLATLSQDAGELEGLAETVRSVTRDTGWTPTVVSHVAGALRYTQYDFLRRWVMKFIAYSHGQPTDTSRDHEYTDWPALARFLDLFLAGQ